MIVVELIGKKRVIYDCETKNFIHLNDIMQ